MQAEVLARLPMDSVMRGLAMVRQTSRDVLRFPRIQPAPGTASGMAGAPGSDGGSIFTSGFVGSWAGETPAFQDVDPAFGFFDIPIRKIRVATRLSNDFLADAITNPLTFLSTDGARNMALVEDQGFVRGDGGPMQPQGIVNAPITQMDITGTTAHTISNTTAALGSATKIMNLQYALPSQYQNGAQWLLHRLSENDIRQLINAMGAFIWAPGFDAPQPALLGKPVKKSDFVTHPANTGDIGLIYGDFSSYIIAERAMITITILRERFADTDQTGIILWERVGGAPWNIDAFRLGSVT
jgi:HK97 family phage major capsid protein